MARFCLAILLTFTIHCGGEGGAEAVLPGGEQDLPIMDAGLGDAGLEADGGTPGMLPDAEVGSDASGAMVGDRYWVSVDGSDAHGCTNESTDACATIQRGVSVLGPGDTLNILSGTYSDDGGRGAFAPADTYCGWLDGRPASSVVCVNTDGTPERPITIQAAPGHEGRVVVDARGDKIGVHLQNSDYVHVRGLRIINAQNIGIASWGQPENSVADVSRLSIGVLIENNEIEGVRALEGMNGSAVGMWGTEDWIVRNNRLSSISAEGSTLAAGIQSYGVINAIVENNHISDVDFGVYWKDHFLEDDAGAGVPVQESEIRFNVIENVVRGFFVSGANEQAGYNSVHHNVIRNYSSEGINVIHQYNSMEGQATGLEVYNNLFDGVTGRGVGIVNDVYRDVRVVGNIFLRNRVSMQFIVHDESEHPELVESNFNAFDERFGQIEMDVYSGMPVFYRSLSQWQGAASMDALSLGLDRPGDGSVLVPPGEVSTDLRGYCGSPEAALMPDGSAVGPYQHGDEVIGVLDGFPSY